MEIEGREAVGEELLERQPANGRFAESTLQIAVLTRHDGSVDAAGGQHEERLLTDPAHIDFLYPETAGDLRRLEGLARQPQGKSQYIGGASG